MADAKKVLSKVLESIQQSENEPSVLLSPSFHIELLNYAQHAYARDLDDYDLTIVLEAIGTSAVRKARANGETGIGAGHFRALIGELCTNPFSDCSAAAETILRSANRRASADTLAKLRDEGTVAIQLQTSLSKDLA